MPFDYNKKLVGSAQHLRKNMTDEEKQLWYQFLRRLPVTVRRQKNIGNYIVDFYIASAKIVIERQDVQVKKDRKQLTGKQLFVEFYKKQKSNEPRQEIVDLFATYLAKAEEEKDETDKT